VSELSHHDADDGFHEINLSGKQLVFLFMMGACLAVAIFLLGVKIGRDVKSDRVSNIETGDTVASATPAAASDPTQPAASGGPPAAEPPAPAAEPDDALSYAKRLQGETATTEKLKPASPAPPASVDRTAAVKITPQSPAAPAPASAGRPGAWIVQVISLQDRASASKIATDLSRKGYPAFVVDPAPGSPRFYRVQVGGYADKNDAEQASRRLEKDEQFKPLVRSR
jgi:septal ring-binding cell division protein DamX